MGARRGSRSGDAGGTPGGDFTRIIALLRRMLELKVPLALSSLRRFVVLHGLWDRRSQPV